MSQSENSRAGAEARQMVTHRTGGVTRHERALQQYLLAAQFQQQQGDSSGSARSATPPAASAATPESDQESSAADGTPASSPQAAAMKAGNADACPPGAIVVGVDGSEASDAAVEWAADEADRRHATLRLVHAYRLPTMGGFPGYNAYPDDLLEQLREAGEHLLVRTAAAVAGRHPDLQVISTLFHGRAEVGLRAASEHAQLTVVGKPPRTGGLSLSSVGLSVTSTNPAPVAVIHPHQKPQPTGPVVVGVDGSPLSEAAVAFAFDEAAIRRTDLLAVHAWNDVYLDSRRLEPLLIDPEVLEQKERALLSERLAGWREKYPDVPVRQRLAHQRPTTALLQSSHTAQAVVVGSHGRGGFAGMLLGSTSQALATHAGCPVIVVRNSGGRPG
jgi:nucleotide-binding universal stress UspA family protein